jgi:hypothetical protein
MRCSQIASALDALEISCQHLIYVLSPIAVSGFELGSAKLSSRSGVIHRTAFFAAALSLLLTGCTSEPLVSRKGVSSMALGEIGLETLAAFSRESGSAYLPHLEDEEVSYIGGVIPVKRSLSDSDHRVDNGTRFFVDGHKRGMLPWVGTLRKPGPHRVRLELPAFEPYTLTLGEPILLHTSQGDLAAWPPVIVHMLSGEIFTTQETTAVDVDRNSGSRKKTDIAKKAGRDPLLIVTTTTKVQAGWRKLGHLRVVGQVAGNENRDQIPMPPLSLGSSNTRNGDDGAR